MLEKFNNLKTSERILVSFLIANGLVLLQTVIPGLGDKSNIFGRTYVMASVYLIVTRRYKFNSSTMSFLSGNNVNVLRGSVWQLLVTIIPLVGMAIAMNLIKVLLPFDFMLVAMSVSLMSTCMFNDSYASLIGLCYGLVPMLYSRESTLIPVYTFCIITIIVFAVHFYEKNIDRV